MPDQNRTDFFSDWNWGRAFWIMWLKIIIFEIRTQTKTVVRENESTNVVNVEGRNRIEGICDILMMRSEYL